MIAETSPLALALSWALVHFLWQGAAIALVTFALWQLLRLTSAARYRIGVAALAAMLIAPCVTTLWLLERQPARAARDGVVATSGGGTAVADSPVTAPSAVPSASQAAPASPRAANLGLMAVLVAWLAGVTVLSIRLFGGWMLARRLVSRSVSPVPHAIEVVARRVAARLAVDRVVRVLESSAVTVPVMVGWAKPVVLMPASALSGLSPVQIEALIAHELAHVRRLDYLVNLIQSAVETLLFYHPAVWWLSKEVRMEREHCCDDLAVEVCDRLEYVNALTTLAAMATPRLALAATDGSLVRRVRRLLGPGAPEQGAASGWAAAILGVAILTGAPVALRTARAGDPTAPAAQVTEQQRASQVQEVAPEPARKGDAVQGPRETPREVVPEASHQDGSRAPARYAEWAPTQAEQAAAKDAAARLEAAAEALRRLAKERVGLQIQFEQERMAGTVRTLQLELAELERDQAQLRRSFEVGLANEGVLRENAARIAMTRQKIADEQKAMDLRRMELQLDQQRVDLELEHQRALEAMMKAEEGLKAETRSKLEAAEHERGEVLRYELAAQSKQDRANLLLTPVADPAATARTGDVIVVSIDGEPDLPKTYVVQDSGAIRLPLLGSINVAGLTARQIGDEIVKQLARVSKDFRVAVSMRRP